MKSDWWKQFLPYVLSLALGGGLLASYTAQQRAIGALKVELRIADSAITAAKDSADAARGRARSAEQFADGLERELVGLRSRAAHSDAVATAATASYRELRDQALTPTPGSAVPTLGQIIGAADTALNACAVARADCKARADREQQRGDSARAAARAHASESDELRRGLATSQANEKKLQGALPSTTGKVIRAGVGASVGAGLAVLVCVVAGCG